MSSTEPEITCWRARFDLPFMISVPDSFDDVRLRDWLEAELRSPGSAVPVPYSPRLSGNVVAIGPTVHLPDPASLGAPFEVSLGDSQWVRLGFLRRIRNVDVPMVMGGELRPCYGLSAFTSVIAEFDVATSATLTEMDEVRPLVIEAMNRFLAVYRDLLGAFWAQPVGPDMIPAMEFDTHYVDGTVLVGRRQATPPGGPLLIGQPGLLRDDRETAARDLLQDSRWTPALAHETILLAREHHSRRRYRNAIIDSATAFEIFLADIIHAVAATRGLNTQDTELLLRDANGRWLDVTEIAKDSLRKLGIDFAGTAEYQRWNRHVRKPRNTLVHGGHVLMTEADSQRALHGCEEAVQKLRDLAGL